MKTLQSIVLFVGLLLAAPALAQEVVESPAPAGGSLGMSYALDPTFVSTQGQPRVAPRNHPRVVRVQPGSSAARAGLAEGDILLEVNGRDGREPALFPNREPGTRYTVRVRRGTQEREVTLVVGPPVGSR